MQIYNFDKKQWYKLSEIIKNHRDLFPKFDKKHSERQVIKTCGITSDDLIFMKIDKNNNNNWVKSTKSYNKSQCFFERNWTQSFINNNSLPNAPSIIKLEKDQKFKDEQNNLLQIETRGQRTPEDILFRAKDVETEFKIPELIHSIQRKDNNSAYKQKIHYDKYKCIRKNKISIEVFLTFPGILRVLFCSRSGVAEKFVKYATNILFVHQFGTPDQKQELSSELLGISLIHCKKIIADAYKRSGVYLLILGKVRTLRKSMNIPMCFNDEAYVVKFGCTKNFCERFKQHTATFGKIDGVHLHILQTVDTDKEQKMNAETDLKKWLRENAQKLKYKDFKELAIMDLANREFIQKKNDFLNKLKEKYFTQMETFRIKMLEKNGEINTLKKALEGKNETITSKEKELESKNETIKIMQQNINEQLQNKDQVIASKEEQMKLVKEKYEMENKMLKMQIKLLKQNKRKRRRPDDNSDSDLDISSCDENDKLTISEPKRKKAKLC